MTASELRPDDAQIKGFGTNADPPDFKDGGGEHRKSVLASASLIAVLISSDTSDVAIFGVKVAPTLLWFFLGIGHVYFFTMWRLTTFIERDTEKKFWNLGGLWKQATTCGTRSFPGKTKAQLVMIRALPIWAFLIGLAGIGWKLWPGLPGIKRLIGI